MITMQRSGALLRAHVLQNGSAHSVGQTHVGQQHVKAVILQKLQRLCTLAAVSTR